VSWEEERREDMTSSDTETVGKIEGDEVELREWFRD